MSGTCKDCKWWGVPTKIEKGHSSCGHDLVGSSDLRQVANNLHVNDCLGEWILTTGPDFGCIHHEPKVEP